MELKEIIKKMRKLLNFVLLQALMMTAACSKSFSEDCSGLYIGDYKFYDHTSNSYRVRKDANAVFLKKDSTFKYQKWRIVNGKGTWHDNGKEIILTFKLKKDAVERALDWFDCNQWYEGANMILIKKGEDNLILNTSTLKRVTGLDSIQEINLYRSISAPER